MSVLPDAYGDRTELLVHAKPILVLATQEVATVVVGALVDALDRERPLLQGTRVLPQSLAGWWFQDADAVSQGWPVKTDALGATTQTDFALALTARLVPEEGTRFEELVSCNFQNIFMNNSPVYLDYDT